MSNREPRPEVLQDMPPSTEQELPAPPPKRRPMFSASSSDESDDAATTSPPPTKKATAPASNGLSKKHLPASRVNAPSSSDDDNKTSLSTHRKAPVAKPSGTKTKPPSQLQNGPLKTNAAIRFDALDTSSSSSDEGGVPKRRYSSHHQKGASVSMSSSGVIAAAPAVVLMEDGDDDENDASPMGRIQRRNRQHSEPPAPTQNDGDATTYTAGESLANNNTTLMEEDIEVLIPNASLRLGYDIDGTPLYEHHSAYSAVSAANAKGSVLSSFCATSTVAATDRGFAGVNGGSGMGMLSASTSMQMLGGVPSHVTTLQVAGQGNSSSTSKDNPTSTSSIGFMATSMSRFTGAAGSSQRSHGDPQGDEKGSSGSPCQSTTDGDVLLGTPRSVSTLGNGSTDAYLSDGEGDATTGDGGGIKPSSSTTPAASPTTPSAASRATREGEMSKESLHLLSSRSVLSSSGRARGVSTLNLSESFIGVPMSSNASMVGGTTPSKGGLGGSDTRKSLSMDYGDEYIGDVVRIEGPWSSNPNAPQVYVPHGKGTLQSSTGQHCYIGNFAYRAREGHGKLVTSRFVLWCMWKSNRPDLTQPARIDYVNGDRYSGYLSAATDKDRFMAFTNHALAAKEAAKKDKQLPPSMIVDPMLPEPMSKFSSWVNSTAFHCFKWGELVSAGTGTRYFGQWQGGAQNGYGMQMFPSGDRYVGMFRNNAYQGPGAFFTSRNRGVCSDCVRRAEASYHAVAQLDIAQMSLLNADLTRTGERARGEFVAMLEECEASLARPNDGNVEGASRETSLGRGDKGGNSTTASKNASPSPIRTHNNNSKIPPGMPPSLTDGVVNPTVAADGTTPPSGFGSGFATPSSMMDGGAFGSPSALRLGGLPNCGLRAPLGPKPGAVAPRNVFAAIPRDGTVFDGLWQNGQFKGEASHVTLPDRTRITGTWASFNKALEGAVFSAPNEHKLRRWREHFHFESLFGSNSPKARSKDHNDAARIRRKVRSCGSRQQLSKVLRAYVSRHPSFLNALKVFRRFFFTSFGCCGNPSEVGSGGGQSTGYMNASASVDTGRSKGVGSTSSSSASDSAKKMSSQQGGVGATAAPHESLGRGIGWCRVRNSAGGCIHPGKGRPIVPGDVEAALTDIFSFLASARRYVEELLTEAEDDDTEDGEGVGGTDEEKEEGTITADDAKDMGRTHLGDTAPATDGEKGDADQSHKHHHPVEIHDKGEKYEFALDAFHDHDGCAIVERVMFDYILHEIHDPLMNLYAHVHASELRAVEVSLQRLHGITLDDLGVNFGRHESEEKLFNPYAEAERALESISGERTLSGKLSSLRKWSHAIDSSTKLAQIRLHEHYARSTTTASSEDRGASMAKAAAEVESGSTDDLLPIHQYVLIKAAVPRLFLEAKLLLDLTSSETLIDMTSQDSFCITTLQACVSTIPELDLDVRDGLGVLTPAEVFAKKAEDVVMSLVSFASIELQNFRPLEVTLLSLVAYGNFVNSLTDTVQKEHSTHNNLVKFEKFQRSLAKCIHSRLPSPLPLVSVTGNHLASFQYVQSWVPYLLDCMAGIVNESTQAFHWQQQHVWYQRQLSKEKLAKKVLKMTGGNQLPTDPSLLPPEARLEKPPVLFVSMEYVSQCLMRCGREAADGEGFSILRSLLSLPSMVDDAEHHHINGDDSSYSSQQVLPRWLSDLLVAHESTRCDINSQSKEVTPLHTRRNEAIQDLLFTQRIAGVTDLPESLLPRGDAAAPSSASSPPHQGAESSIYEDMCDINSLRSKLLSLCQSDQLDSSLSRVDMLNAWYICLPAGARRALHTAKALNAACRCLQTSGLELCMVGNPSEKDPPPAITKYQWINLAGQAANTTTVGPLLVAPHLCNLLSDPTTSSTPLSVTIPMKIGKLSDALGLVDSVASMGATLHADLDLCTQAVMDILNTKKAGGDDASSMDSEFANRVRKIITAISGTQNDGSHIASSSNALGKDQGHSDSDDSVVEGSDWSFEASSMCSSTCDLSNPCLLEGNTTLLEYLSGVTTYKDLCSKCCVVGGGDEASVVGEARDLRSLIEEAVGNSRFVLRVDVCHDSAVYKEASRAVLRCNPKDAS